MKKLFVIALCLLLLAAPTFVVAFAASGTQSDGVTHFLNPTAVAVVGNKLFVADNIEDGESMIVCFDVSGDTPAFQYNERVEGNVTELSAKGEEGLYAVLSDKVVEYAVSDKLSVVQTFENLSGVKHFISGVVDTENHLGEYYVTSDNIFFKNPRQSDVQSSDYFYQQNPAPLQDIRGFVSVGSFVYYLCSLDNNFICKRIDGIERGFDPNDPLNKNGDLLTSFTDPKGLFVWGNNVGLFTENSIHFVEIGSSNSTINALIPAKSTDNNGYDVEEKGKIVDVTAANEVLYVLNANHKVEIYKRGGANFQDVNTIGTEEVTDPVPQKYTSFTLVRNMGYPSNIIFKTSGEHSVANLVNDAEEYIVLGYDGDENSDFCYVLYDEADGYGFGWVRKSDELTNHIVNTAAGPNGLTYKTKFVTPDAVWVHELPRESSAKTPFTQTANSRTQVTVLQKFFEGQTEWDYVQYDGDKRGFVKNETLFDQYYIDLTLEGDVHVVGQFKINTSLFGTVRIYDNPNELTDEHLAVDSSYNPVVLHSGARVTLVENCDNGTSLIQIDLGNGTNATGYVKTSCLINKNALTTNAIFGIVTVCVAAVLAVTLTVVFVRKKKNSAAPPEQNN